MKHKNSIRPENYRIAAKGLMEFLKEELNMSEARWEKFVLRYAGKDTTTIIKYIRNYAQQPVSPTLARYFSQALIEEAERINKESLCSV